MIHGDNFHRKSNSGLRSLRKLRVARRNTLLRRMLSGHSVDGAGDTSDTFHRSPEGMSSRSTVKELRPVPEDDSSRSTLSCNSLSISSPAAYSTSEDGFDVAKLISQLADKSAEAGKSAVAVCVAGDEIRRSTATAAHGVISLIGRRREMEDAVTAVPALLETLGGYGYGFFGVYDGHGGFGVAEKCSERLHLLVAEELAEKIGGADWEGVMRMSFARMDREVCEEEGGERREVKGNTVGSTAVVAVVGAEEIVVANCGDSRAVLCRGGVAMPLSRDHKALYKSLHSQPERPDERKRVEAAGGSIVNWYGGPRVLGVLATSRSIGDHCMRPYVISVPEVTVWQRTESDEFLILASDGLWDVVSNDMACDLVKKCVLYDQREKKREMFSEGNCGEGYAYADHLATMLAEMAISRGSKDNISVIVVMLC